MFSENYIYEVNLTKYNFSSWDRRSFDNNNGKFSEKCSWKSLLGKVYTQKKLTYRNITFCSDDRTSFDKQKPLLTEMHRESVLGSIPGHTKRNCLTFCGVF